MATRPRDSHEKLFSMIEMKFSIDPAKWYRVIQAAATHGIEINQNDGAAEQMGARIEWNYNTIDRELSIKILSSAWVPTEQIKSFIDTMIQTA